MTRLTSIGREAVAGRRHLLAGSPFGFTAHP